MKELLKSVSLCQSYAKINLASFLWLTVYICFVCSCTIITVCLQHSPMNVPRSLFYLGELNGQLYAVAGWTAVNEDTPTVEQYVPSLDSWQRLSNFPLDVHEHAGLLPTHNIVVNLPRV